MGSKSFAQFFLPCSGMSSHQCQTEAQHALPADSRIAVSSRRLTINLSASVQNLYKARMLQGLLPCICVHAQSCFEKLCCSAGVLAWHPGGAL